MTRGAPLFVTKKLVHGDIDNVPNNQNDFYLMCYVLFLQHRVSDQTSKASAIGATYYVKQFEGCDTQGVKK